MIIIVVNTKHKKRITIHKVQPPQILSRGQRLRVQGLCPGRGLSCCGRLSESPLIYTALSADWMHERPVSPAYARGKPYYKAKAVVEYGIEECALQFDDAHPWTEVKEFKTAPEREAWTPVIDAKGLIGE